MEFMTQSVKPFFLYMAYHQTHHPQFARHRGWSPRGRFGDALGEMDESIGQLIRHIQTLGIANETLVWVTSDNGQVTLNENKAAAGQLTFYLLLKAQLGSS